MKKIIYISLSLLLLNSSIIFPMEKKDNSNNEINNFSQETKEQLGNKLIKVIKENIGDPNAIDIIKELIINGANINAKDEKGNTPLILISLALHNSGMKALDAIVPLTEMLINAGADIFIKNNDNHDVLEYANAVLQKIQMLNGVLAFNGAMTKQKELVNLLKQTEIIQKNELVIKDLTQFINKNKINKIKEMLIKNPNLMDKFGENALHIAAKNNNYLMFNYILLLKPELFNKLNHEGKTATDKYPEIIYFLIIKNRLTLVQKK